MEHHLEHSIRLSEESEHQSLYKWFLQEVSKDGTAKGQSVIPWPWSLWFNASEIEYLKIVEVKTAPDAEKNQRPEMIRAKLQPAPKFSHGGTPVLFSMLGTDRAIKDIGLRIFRMENDESPERCRVTGVVSYTADFDFEDYHKQDDFLEIDVLLGAKNFDECAA